MISVANEIEKLVELKERGVISQEDFEVQKRRLLSGDNVSEEKIFFSGDGVKITTTLFSLPNNTSFAMSGVTAVRLHKQSPSKSLPLLLIIVGFFFFFAGVKTGASSFGSVLITIGVVVAALSKPTYIVVLSTASGETQALRSKNEKWMLSVVEALNACIVRRG
ncbi:MULTISPECIES: DUF6232 family protein [Pseudomonadota]|nr:DUF6232 family protein [Chromobacterium sinusclupearum]